MIDLEAKLARWRREREAIPNFNFKPENLDDLEDELRFEIEHSLKEGATPDEAWVRGLRRIGQSLSTTRDFVQTEFLPALFHLLKSWGKPGLLVILFLGSLTLRYFETTFEYFGRSWPIAAPLALVSLGVMLVVLPGPTCRKAILLGLGNVAILLPVLYGQMRPHLVASILAPEKPGPSVFGWLSVPLEVGVVIAANLWWWKRQKPGERRLIVGIAGTILVILLLAPFCGEVVGLLSIREVFRLPTADEVPWINQAQGQFLQWKFPRVLVDSMLLITTLLPLLLSAFLWALLRGTRGLRASGGVVAPQRDDWPCLMVLFSFGSSWFYSSTVEITFTNQMREAEATLQSSFHFMRGLEAAVLFTAIVYLLSAFEWTRRLRQAKEVRNFYAIVILLVEIGVILGVTFCQKMGEVLFPLSKHEVSGQPLWLSWLLGLAALVLLMDQTRTLWNKSRRGMTVSSQGTIDGTRIVQLGLALGLVLSWAWLILAEVALVMAYISVVMIQAMVAWGSSISEPLKYHFDPWSYGFTTHSEYGIFAGAFFLGCCLIAGLVLVMLLSGLEFLRWHGYRYHQVRQAARTQLESSAGPSEGRTW